jgi:hypothetical protein
VCFLLLLFVFLEFSMFFDYFVFSILESDPHLEKLKATMKDVTTYSIIELRSAYV